MDAKRLALRVVLPAVLVAVLAFVGITGYALESSDVAIVETQRADGGTRRTHVWYVEHGGELWLEAGRAENGWFVDVSREPRLRFSADGRSGVFRAQAVLEPDAHPRLRAQLRSKYGWRDARVAIYVDQSQSLSVRLVPVEIPRRDD
jgi:hypothetical protein